MNTSCPQRKDIILEYKVAAVSMPKKVLKTVRAFRIRDNGLIGHDIAPIIGADPLREVERHLFGKLHVAGDKKYPRSHPRSHQLLQVLKGEMSGRDIMQRLGLKDEKHFREHYQQRAVKVGVVGLTIPDKPKSRLQKYRLTAQGKTLIQTYRKP